MILRPLGANIVLKVMEAPTKNGGIFLPESKREETMQRPVGEVIAVGPDVNEPGTGDEISVGDVLVFWKPNAGYVYGLDGKMNLLVKRADVIAFVESDATATPEEAAKIRARHEKIMAEQKEARQLAENAAMLEVPAMPMPKIAE